jgi:dTDP-4-amino-4,6-dideoxygalactose transaminase
MDYDCCLADHDAIQKLGDAHGIRIIHDAAHALGSSYNDKPVGSFSDITMFSFDPVKTITCIDGGALVVRTEEEVAKLHQMRLIGMGQPASVMYSNRRAWTYDVSTLGFRYHMANLHAAIGVEQLKKMARVTSNRQEACKRYSANLSDIPQVRTPRSTFEDVTPFLYYIRVPAVNRADLRAWLSERKVDTGIHWQPGHTFSLLKDMRRGDLTVTEAVGQEVVSLPLHTSLTQTEVDYVCGEIKRFFEQG